MQSAIRDILICLPLSFLYGIILSNFLQLTNAKKGEDFTFKEFLKNLSFKNLNVYYILVLFAIFCIVIKYTYILPFILVYSPLIFSLILLFCTDFMYMIIPDTASIIIACTGIYNIASDFSFGVCLSHLAGCALGAGVFWIIDFLYRKISGNEGFGMGDIKLFGALGLAFGLKINIVIMILSVFISAIFSIGFLIINIIKKVKEEYLPFGPFIAIATLITCIIPTNSIIYGYLDIIDAIIAKIF